MATHSSQPPLTPPPEQMRRLGYQVVDLVVDALAGLRDRPPAGRAGPEELAGLLGEPVPRAGGQALTVERRRRGVGGSTPRASARNWPV
jgi:hypothetical protein